MARKRNESTGSKNGARTTSDRGRRGSRTDKKPKRSYPVELRVQAVREVEDAALMAIDPYPWSAPVEDVRLRKR